MTLACFGILAATGDAATASPFELVASTVGDETSAADPWVQAITMPTGTNKLVVDVMWCDEPLGRRDERHPRPGRGRRRAVHRHRAQRRRAPGISSTNPAIASSIWSYRIAGIFVVEPA